MNKIFFAPAKNFFARDEVFAEAAAGRSLWKDSWRRLRKNPSAIFGLGFLLVQACLALLAPYLSSYSYEHADLLLGALPPGGEHLLGTDDLGRDLLARILYGSRISLAVGLLATAVSMVIGVSYGAISGYIGGRVDSVMMRFVEVLYALPFTFFVIILMVIFGRNIYLLFVALGAVQWLNMARIVRGQVLSIKNKEYIEAALAMGVSHARIIWRHVVPNIMGPVIVYATLTIPVVILEEAFLSFLGLGVQEPKASWGTLIADGVGALETYPWMLIFPALSLMLVLLALNFFGDGLREALDPQGRE
jgi:oligopeptide transport system permease protein